MGQLDGKIAVVTGASSGSGLGIARRFTQEGATVFMLARGKERLEEAAAPLGDGAIPVATDLGDPDSVRDTFAQVESRFGKLDILINNAAVYRPSPVEQLSDQDIVQTLATNLNGVMYTCRAAIPLMRAAGCGDIINVSSESTIDPFPLLSVYVASKAGLEAFTPILAEEVRDDDIRVTTLIQGTAHDTGSGATDFAWDPEMAALAGEVWTKLGLLNRVGGLRDGQRVDDIGDVHMFIVTRPRTQRLDVVNCRSF